MRIKVNEQYSEVFEGISGFKLREGIKPEADIIILNGFPIKEDKLLKDGDSISFIKRGEIPKKEELEALLVARHTPKVYEIVKNISIGIAGAGGLGSNIALSLARLGVINIKVVDFDIVEPSNLNRQQYYIKDIGDYKVTALKRTLEEVNPFIEVIPIIKKLSKENIKETFNDVITRKINNKFYICGDGVNEAKEGSGLMAPRVAICANHMANCALRIILGEEGE